MMFVTRLGVGIGEAACAPAATSWIGDLVPPERRARAMAGFMLAVPIGVMLSFAVSGPAAQAFGWRTPFTCGAFIRASATCAIRSRCSSSDSRKPRTNRMAEFTGKNVLVTGASSGIGWHTARLFAKSGARVLATLVHALERRGLKRGLASLCLGGGNAVAMVVEMISMKS